MCPIAWLYTSINELIQVIKVWYAQTPDMTVLVSLIDFSFSQQFTRNVIVSHTNDLLTNFPYKVWQEHIYDCNSHHVILWMTILFLLSLTKVKAYMYCYHKYSMHRNCASQPSGTSTIFLRVLREITTAASRRGFHTDSRNEPRPENDATSVHTVHSTTMA